MAELTVFLRAMMRLRGKNSEQSLISIKVGGRGKRYGEYVCGLRAGRTANTTKECFHESSFCYLDGAVGVALSIGSTGANDRRRCQDHLPAVFV